MAGVGNLAAVAGLALCLTAPEAAATDKNSEPPDRNTVTSWTITVGDPLEAPPSGTSPPPAPARRPPQIMPPPPGDVLDAVTMLLLSCPKWQAGQTPGYETEAHVCRLLAGHDPAYGDGRVAGSWMTAAVLGGIWLVLRLPDRLASILALVRRRRNWP